MKLYGAQAIEARRKAEERFAKANEQSAAALRDKQKAEAVESAKTSRLRALRLAKEAADKEAAAAKPAPVRRKRAAQTAPDTAEKTATD